VGLTGVVIRVEDEGVLARLLVVGAAQAYWGPVLGQGDACVGQVQAGGSTNARMLPTPFFVGAADLGRLGWWLLQHQHLGPHLHRGAPAAPSAGGGPILAGPQEALASGRADGRGDSAAPSCGGPLAAPLQAAPAGRAAAGSRSCMFWDGLGCHDDGNGGGGGGGSGGGSFFRVADVNMCACADASTGDSAVAEMWLHWAAE
jgi:hypothetical protein